MILILLSYLGGVLTIASPCILPILPFVFARADRPFVKSGLPLLIGMALSFALVASLAAIAGGWAVEANRYGRFAAILLLALFGLALLFPALATRATRPLVDLGARLSAKSAGSADTIGTSALLGVATGLLWAPCAGPVLGLILTGAALQGANAGTSLLLLAYAAGAATSLALALLIGGKVFAFMKRSLGAGEWVRRGLGAAVLAGVVAIALGLDTGFLTRLSLASTNRLEQGLLDGLAPERASVVMQGGPAMMSDQGNAMMSGGAMTGGNGAMMTGNNPAMMMRPKSQGQPAPLAVEGALPGLSGAVEWLNSKPLSPQELKGKVVLVDFWTYSCINCLRTIPYVRAWAAKYADQGLVVIGVHTPEFAFEKDVANVRKAAADLGISYPIAIDNDYGIWRAFNNQYWPAHYFIDAQGRIRYQHFGEGNYDVSEQVIQTLLAEANGTKSTTDLVSVTAMGAEAASDARSVLSPETYVGYGRAENFVSPGGIVQDVRHTYEAGAPRRNEWGLSGDWTIGRENARLDAADGGIVYRFHARDLHLVLSPAADGKPVRFKVTIDGAAPRDDHGVDTLSDGSGVIREQRLYQLVRQKGEIKDRVFEIRFLDPGARAYAFTFG